MFTEQEARKYIGKEYCNWLDSKNLYWCEKLPYSMMPGWTNGISFSLIFQEEQTDVLNITKNRYDYIINWM